MTRLQWLQQQVKNLRENPIMDCVEWPFAKTKPYDGYGSVGYNGKNVTVHRLVYQLYYDKDPGNKMVLHACGNTICFNPAHLYCSTAKQNTRDMLAHYGYCPTGPRKLTETDVRDILKMLKIGIKQKDIAAHFGISRPHVSWIKNGKGWKHVLEDKPITKRKPRRTKATATLLKVKNSRQRKPRQVKVVTKSTVIKKAKQEEKVEKFSRKQREIILGLLKHGFTQREVAHWFDARVSDIKAVK